MFSSSFAILNLIMAACMSSVSSNPVPLVPFAEANVAVEVLMNSSSTPIAVPTNHGRFASSKSLVEVNAKLPSAFTPVRCTTFLDPALCRSKFPCVWNPDAEGRRKCEFVPKNCKIEVFDGNKLIWNDTFAITMKHDMFRLVQWHGFRNPVEDKADVVRMSKGCRLVVLGDEDNACKDVDYEDNIRVSDGTSGNAVFTREITANLVKSYDINGRYASSDVQNDLCGIWIMGEVYGKIKSNVCSIYDEEEYIHGLRPGMNCARSWLHRHQTLISTDPPIWQGNEKYCENNFGPKTCPSHMH